MTWGVSTARRRPGELLTRSDVCHLHADRDGAERCGAAAPGAPDLVRLKQYSERVLPGAVVPVGHVACAATAAPAGGRRTVRPQPVREAWSTGAEVAGAPWQTHRPPRTPFVDIPIAGPLLSSTMSVIAQAIADRQSEIDRLQAEIKALTDVEQLLGASAPAAGSASRRSSPRKATAASAESQPEVKPQRKRREMTAAEKKAVSERMTAYWAERRKKAAKK